MGITDLSQFLRQFPFFQDLEENDLEKLFPLFITRSYERGQDIFLEGEEGDELFIIKSGVVKIYRYDETRDIILAIFRNGDFFGEMAVLENEQVRSASAMSLEKTSVYVLKREDFVNLLNRNPKMTKRILETALDRLRKANEMITDLTFLDVRARVVKMMLRLSEKHGVPYKSGVLIDLKLTHQQMADMTGAVRETVTKVLLDLQSEGMIKIEKKKVFIPDVGKFLQSIGT